jgi:peroxiredoxin
VQPGEAAPDFTLPAVHRDGDVSLSDYRGKSPLLLAINRGLWCPFCRRQIAQLGATSEKLKQIGVETLAVVATIPERARMYFRMRPVRVPLVADPDLVTHRAYGLPRPPLDAPTIEAMRSIQVNPGGELPAPVPVIHAIDALNKQDGFVSVESDDHERAHQMTSSVQMTGQFLVNREGIVRWSFVEMSRGGMASAGQYPSDDELLETARSVLD